MGVIDVETIEQFLARGGQIKVLDTTERAVKDPNREFSICSAGIRERKKCEELENERRR